MAVPEPAPEPFVTVIQLLLLTAVQVHAVPDAVTAVDVVPALAVTF